MPWAMWNPHRNIVSNQFGIFRSQFQMSVPVQHTARKINHIQSLTDSRPYILLLLTLGIIQTQLLPHCSLDLSCQRILQHKNLWTTEGWFHVYTHTGTHTQMDTQGPSPWGTGRGDGSVGAFQQGSSCSSGSSAPPGLHAASRYTLNISPPAPGAVHWRQ